MSMHNQNPSLLVLTSTFPRWKGDTDPPFVFELCRRLTARFRIHVLAPRAPGSAANEEIEGMRISRFSYFFRNLELLAYNGGILPNLKRKPWRYILVPFFLACEMNALFRVVKSETPHLIHAHWLLPQGLVAAVVNIIGGTTIPLLSTSHGGDMYGLKGRLFDSMRRFVLTSSSGVTVVSRAMGDAVLALGVRRDVIRVIPMGVDLRETFTPSGTLRKEKNLLFVGRLIDIKGLSYLIRAMPEVVQRHPEARLTVVGSGPEETSLKAELAALGLPPIVSFAGPVENIHLPSFYREAAIVVFPSVIAGGGNQEGFGLVLVEAMGCECAVVASDLPAVRDIVIHGKTGLVFPERNIEALARSINILLENRDLRITLGREGRRFVAERYDWAVVTDSYERFILELMADRPANRDKLSRRMKRNTIKSV